MMTGKDKRITVYKLDFPFINYFSLHIYFGVGGGFLNSNLTMPREPASYSAPRPQTRVTQLLLIL